MSVRRPWAKLPIIGALSGIYFLSSTVTAKSAGVLSGVTVTPVPATSPQRAPNTNGWSADFTVTNTTTATRTFDLTCQGSWSPNPPITCVSLSATQVTLNPSQSTTVTATYNVGSFSGSGTGTITLDAENTTPSPGAVGNGTQNIPVGSSGTAASVTPDAGSRTDSTYLNYTQKFTIKNLSNYPVTYSAVPSCTGAGVGAGCTVSPTSVALATTGTSGDTAAVTVAYQSKANGTTGLVKLYAQEGGSTRDSGWVNVTVGSTSGSQMAPTVSIVDVNSGTTTVRSVCLTIALGPSVASECGDLRMAHALQTLRTRGIARTPVLLYASQTAEPQGLVVAHVTMPGTAKYPDWIDAVLKVGGVRKDSVRFTGNEWTASRPRRIMVRDTLDTAEGIYNYTLEVSSVYGANRYAAATASGSFVLVDRRTSPYGKGWWPAGLEKLNVSNMLWIGGDGSTRQYVATGIPNKWVAPSVDHPDTLEQSGSEYWRWLPNKGKVVFDLTGRHIKTKNRLNDSTVFSYDGSNRLSTIAAPIPTGGTARSWSFSYGTNLVTVSDGIGASPRQVKLYLNAAARVDSIIDPDSSKVSFGYLNSTSGLVTSRTDRLSKIRNFTLDSWRHVTAMGTDPGFSQQTINLTINPLESRGIGCQTSPCSVDAAILAYTKVDGPRTDVADTTIFFLDKYGEPRSIIDAFGGVTTLQRDSVMFPVLVTKTTAPNGRKLGAAYNNRGNVVSVTEDSAKVKGVYANVTTSYTYDTACLDQVASVTPPGQLAATYTYDATNCNTLTAKDGNNNQTSFTYWTTGPGTGLVASVQAPGISGKDSLYYSTAFGNPNASATPMRFRTTITQDAYGRDSVVVTPTDSAQTPSLNQQAVSFYDRKSRVSQTQVIGAAVSYWNPYSSSTNSVPASTITTTNSYDREGRLTQSLTSTTDSTGVATRSTFAYDDAGRTRTKTAGGSTTTYTYDPAGNPLTQASQRGYSLTMSYDALNRLTTRITPQATYSQIACTPGDPDCRWVFPYYPNDGGTGLKVPADTATFSYDAVGNLLTANNSMAKVSRTYTKSGWLETDSLRLRQYTGTQFFTHVYGLTIRYDSLGRRRMLKHPAALYNWEPGSGSNAVSRDSAIYIYDAGTGALKEVQDLRTHQYTYLDDQAGRQVRLEVRPSVGGAVGIKDSSVYDPDSRVILRMLYPTGGITDSTNLRLDARGKVRMVYYKGLYDGQRQSDTMVYAGHGPLAMAYRNYLNPAEPRLEEYHADGLSNNYTTRETYLQGIMDPVTRRTGYEDLTGRMLRQVSDIRLPLTPSYPYPDSTVMSYDASGNLFFRYRHAYRNNCASCFAHWDNERHYYGADEKLRFVQKTGLGPWGTDLGTVWTQASYDGAWEEYWYDALGRRVLARERRTDFTSGTNARNALTRFVWDGDQLLYEIRIPGGPADNLDATNYSGSRYYGSVGYIHGRGLDIPLALNDSLARVPIADWRGEPEGSLQATGAGADCATNGGIAGCWNIVWPAKRGGMYFKPWADLPPDLAEEWRGSLLAAQGDHSGLLYKRNRYYDPASGRFTQVDPIGIAGGLNVYGFASGDPVNYGDPFGLSDCKEHPQTCADALQGPGFFDPVAILAGGIAGGLEALGARLFGRAAARTVAGGAADELGAGAASETSIPASGPRVTASEQRQINALGEQNGCHTCGAKTPGTKSGNWVGDHEPPTALAKPGEPQTLSPQCLKCSRVQGGQVRQATRRAQVGASKPEEP